MNLLLDRINSDDESTTGVMYQVHGDWNEFLGFTCEDEHRDVKVAGETRIKAKIYQIKLRNEGGLTQKYKSIYPDIHKGMLHLQNVENFKYVYIHHGNTDKHTEGCILIGWGAMCHPTEPNTILNSRDCYRNLYKRIIKALDAGEPVWLTVRDKDSRK